MQTDNLLVLSVSPTATVNAKLTDFGTARHVTNIAERAAMTGNLGSPPYMAPEIIDSQPYDGRADVYSAAIVLFELVTQQEAWAGVSVWQLPSKVMHGERPSLPRTVPLAYRSLVEAAWSAEPDDRPSAEQLCADLCTIERGLQLSNSDSKAPLLSPRSPRSPRNVD